MEFFEDLMMYLSMYFSGLYLRGVFDTHRVDVECMAPATSTWSVRHEPSLCVWFSAWFLWDGVVDGFLYDFIFAFILLCHVRILTVACSYLQCYSQLIGRHHLHRLLCIIFMSLLAFWRRACAHLLCFVLYLRCTGCEPAARRYAKWRVSVSRVGCYVFGG